jgi:hypothetical protein
MICSDRTHRSCHAPSANRYPYCGCDACLEAHRISRRELRKRQSKGAHVCPCGHRFETLNGLRAHRGKVHRDELAVAS